MSEDHIPGADEDDRLHPIEAPRAHHQLYQAFPNAAPRFGRDPVDGLPKPVVPHSVQDALPPHMNRDDFVCMADRRRYVARDEWGAIIGHFDPSEVNIAPDGTPRVQGTLYRRRLGLDETPVSTQRPPYWVAPALVFAVLLGLMLRFSEDRAALFVCALFALALVPVTVNDYLRWSRSKPEDESDAHDDWEEVEPIRPQCQHYARQLQPFPEDPSRRIQFRTCTARRVDYGDFLSLNDQLMYACELREPAIGNRSDLADAFDEIELANAAREAQRKAEEEGTAPGFDVDQELKSELDGATFGNGPHGIFGKSECPGNKPAKRSRSR